MDEKMNLKVKQYHGENKEQENMTFVFREKVLAEDEKQLTSKYIVSYEITDYGRHDYSQKQ